MLVLAPITCCLAGVAISDLLYTCASSFKQRAQKRLEVRLLNSVARDVHACGQCKLA